MQVIRMLLAILAVVPAGAWELSLPVEGLTEKNAADLVERVQNHFQGKKDDQGERILLEISAKDGLLRITVNCPSSVTFGDLKAALKDSEFSLAPRGWEAWGKLAFRWSSETAMTEKQIAALTEGLSKITKKAEVVEVKAEKGKAYHAHLVFGEDAVAIETILKVFEGQEIAPEMAWENWPHMERRDCGARRKPKK